MTVALRSGPRALVLALVLVLVAGVFMVLAPGRAEAQENTGAAATKDCPSAVPPDFYTIGDEVTCTFTFENIGVDPATVTSMTEQQPFVAAGDPGNGPITDVSCTLPGGVTVIDEGDTLPAGQVCTGTVVVTIPDDPTRCNTVFRDRVEFDLLYSSGLTAGAFATHTLAVVCKPTITVTKTADALSKVTDPVNYTITVCNTGLIPVTKTSVVDPLIPGVDAAFGATLAPGACETENFSRVVAAGDPDPLVNTVTATYTAGVQTATATANASTNLFQPAVGVTKSCAPDPVTVGAVVTCTIVVTNTSSADSPGLVNGTISDTLTGNLLDPVNPAVVDAQSNCTATLAVGASCTIVTTRTVLAADPSPLVNTVTVNYNPSGFPNNITAKATDQVIVERPGGEGCTPGFWKQPSAPRQLGRLHPEPELRRCVWRQREPFDRRRRRHAPRGAGIRRRRAERPGAARGGGVAECGEPGRGLRVHAPPKSLHSCSRRSRPATSRRRRTSSRPPMRRGAR